MKAYLAGPMTGYPQYNFPAFDAYRDYLTSRRYEVVSPADIDRKHGFDAITGQGTLPTKRECALRDIEALAGCEVVFLMPGWQQSAGVRMELAAANFLGIASVELQSLEAIAQ